MREGKNSITNTALLKKKKTAKKPQLQATQLKGEKKFAKAAIFSMPYRKEQVGKFSISFN